MKRVLITGANSYIGTSFEAYIKENYADTYTVDTVDMIGDGWRETSFTGYDCVFHVAGIAHQKETEENAHLYYTVNRDLAIETAKKAKADGVGQFVFLSSMSVYGVDVGTIERDTLPQPKSNYGKSKYQAEEAIRSLADAAFTVCILRPPMVYGEGCKGNYQSLVKLASLLPFFPNYTNRRSMIHIDRLSSCVKDYMDNGCSGIFTPQDTAYTCTCQMVAGIRQSMGKRMLLTKLLNPVIHLGIACTTKGKKAFGDLIYTELDPLMPCEK